MIIKIIPDKQRAKSISNMAQDTESFIHNIILKIGINKNQSFLVRDYYEVIRELATAVLLISGFKSIGDNSHKETIEYLSNFKEFSESEISEMQELRIIRNQISYEGKPVSINYLETRINKFNNIINKLKQILEKKLK